MGLAFWRIIHEKERLRREEEERAQSPLEALLGTTKESKEEKAAPQDQASPEPARESTEANKEVEYRRAREADGTFKGNDPATPQNEAWEPPKPPAEPTEPESVQKLVQRSKSRTGKQQAN